MKQIYVYAYLANNLGDDLFVRVLCKRYPHIKFHIFADESYKIKFREILNCCVHSPNDIDVQKADRWGKKFGIENGFFEKMIKKCDAVIHIGGSSFVQHYDDWKALYDSDARLVKKSKKLYLIGANFGPYTDTEYFESYHELFKKYKGICLRDKYSYQLFQDISHVSFAPDVLWNAPVQPKHEKQKKVVFAPIELMNRKGKYSIEKYAQSYLDFHVGIVRQFIRMGYQISMLSFCPYQQDGDMMQKIYDRLTEGERKNLYCLAYENDIYPILHEFENAEIVVGTRFHSIILGLACNCKVLPIIYNQKTRTTLEDLDYPWRLELDDLQSVSVKEWCQKVLSMKIYPTKELKRESEKQFQYTDRLLNK